MSWNINETVTQVPVITYGTATINNSSHTRHYQPPRPPLPLKKKKCLFTKKPGRANSSILKSWQNTLTHKAPSINVHIKVFLQRSSPHQKIIINCLNFLMIFFLSCTNKCGVSVIQVPCASCYYRNDKITDVVLATVSYTFNLLVTYISFITAIQN